MKPLLKEYAFTEEDINLITYALRRYTEDGSITATIKEAVELIEYIERQKKENELL